MENQTRDEAEINFCPLHAAEFSRNTLTVRVTDTDSCERCQFEDRLALGNGEEPEGEELTTWREGKVNEFNLLDYQQKTLILQG